MQFWKMFQKFWLLLNINFAFLKNFLKIQCAYSLTYLAITTCYRSWLQLICGAIHHELFDPKLGRASLSATSTTWLRFEDFTNWVGAIHTSDMTQLSKTLYFNTLHYVDIIVYVVQLLVPSYAPFSSVAERSITLT